MCIAALLCSDMRSLDNMRGVFCNGNGLVNAYSKNGKAADPFFFCVVWQLLSREGFYFLTGLGANGVCIVPLFPP